MSRTKTGTIYALVDPRDGKIRYIGKTTQPILTRLAGHLAQPTNPAMRVWITSLSLQGLTPRIETVSEPSTESLDIEEQRQIRRHAEQGHRLLNSPYYREHLADLNGATARTQGSEPKGAKQVTPEERMARRLFGAMVRARAQGRVPAWWAFCFVVASSPVYCALVALCHLLEIKLVRALLTVLMFAWPLWESGFDRAADDLVLAHLPLTQWAALWTTYGARSLGTYAHDMAWPAAFACLLMAGMAYSKLADLHTGPGSRGRH